MGKTKLVIVCDEKTEPYANYLRQLISTNDDKDGEVKGVVDGSVEAAVWLDKEYIANKATISSSEHVLFIGDNKVSKSETSSMIVKFDKFGMKYGWLGKRAMMQVEDTKLSQEVYDNFIEYCLGYEAEFEKIVMKKPLYKDIAEKSGLVKKDAGTELEDKEMKKDGINKALKAVAGAVGVGAALAVPIIGIPATGVYAANSIQEHKKIKDQQYRALAVILYIDGLREFLEG